ncbi:MAG: hypothetical protein Q8N96_06365 [Methylovulum sp.]|nr:hypothetical protein [Methylovulum sp.]
MATDKEQDAVQVAVGHGVTDYGWAVTEMARLENTEAALIYSNQYVTAVSFFIKASHSSWDRLSIVRTRLKLLTTNETAVMNVLTG